MEKVTVLTTQHSCIWNVVHGIVITAGELALSSVIYAYDPYTLLQSTSRLVTLYR